MGAVKEWAFSVCVAAVVGTVAEMFSPEGSTKRIFRLCITVFFICCLFSPLIGIITDAVGSKGAFGDAFVESGAEYLEEENSVEEDYVSYILSEFQKNIEEIVKETLRELEINTSEVAVSVNIDADNCISINEVEVMLSEDVRAMGPDAVLAIKKRIGITPKISFK